jgi:two-component system, OmpR family, response regulator
MTSILVADDEPHVIRVLKVALEREGYVVATAANGEAALQEIHRQAPDLLISDIQMPRLSGEELCARIATELVERRFPIIVMTSMTFVNEAHWSRQYTNLVLLEKPVSVRRLLPLIRELLEPADTLSSASR